MRLLVVWLINAVALLLLPYLVPSIRMEGILTALLVVVILGLVNTLLRPLLILLTLPVTLLTLGLFIFVINALLFLMVAHWVDGFYVGGFWSALVGSLLYSFVSWLLSALILGKKERA
ncbi:MAG: phage holin family protein [Sterolibacterium sp.]|nr:phage holin family protein [Sterolibacterium sp.]